MQITMSVLATIFFTTSGCSALHSHHGPQQEHFPSSQEALIQKDSDDYIVLVQDSSYKKQYRSEELAKIKLEHGKKASEDIRIWYKLIDKYKKASSWDKISVTNKFFNKYRWISDLENWGSSDYWANPIEFIVSQGGDCEDFALAKYFTLIEMGIPAEELMITIVQLESSNEVHAVLVYRDSTSREPLVLDNITTSVLPLKNRNDIKPLYGLWDSSGYEMSVAKWQHQQFDNWGTPNEQTNSELIAETINGSYPAAVH